MLLSGVDDGVGIVELDALFLNLENKELVLVLASLEDEMADKVSYGCGRCRVDGLSPGSCLFAVLLVFAVVFRLSGLGGGRGPTLAGRASPSGRGIAVLA